MNHWIAGALAVAAAYLIGSIPFGYLTALWARGIDIRTVGSGNIGATNVGRVLGGRFFALVFLLDMLKGLLPTWGLPMLVARATGQPLASLPVLAALATILGHNFPIYLKFRGGKGVATSFGALAALDPFAMAAAAFAFAIFLLLGRMVSLASILAGFAFVAAHFARVDDPWTKDRIAMSLVTLGLLGLLVARHRSNLARIAAGTEAKVHFRRRRTPPSGKARPLLIVAIVALLGSGSTLAYLVTRPAELHCGVFVLSTRARLRTGHQRAERLTFADEGRLLVVACPRYNHLMLYRIDPEGGPALVRDLTLEGRPVALAAAEDRVYVLQRPVADARHVEPGYWDAFGFDGEPVGARFRVGFDPDDMALIDGGQRALVLLSGRAEGETNRPSPALIVVDIAPGSGTSSLVATLEFDHPGDDPERIAIRPDEAEAAVSLGGSNEVARIDLRDPTAPTIAGRVPFPGPTAPGPLGYGLREGVRVADLEGNGLWAIESGAEARPVSESLGEFVDLLGPGGDVWTIGLDAPGSSLGLVGDRPGRLPLRGPANLGSVRPTGLAFAPRGLDGLLAVADRSGGIHLIDLRTDQRAGLDRRP